MIDEAKPEQVPYNVYPLGIVLDKDMLMLGVPASDITSDDDIQAHTKKAQAWIKDMFDRTHGVDERLRNISALMKPGQSPSPDQSPAVSSPEAASPAEPSPAQAVQQDAPVEPIQAEDLPAREHG